MWELVSTSSTLCQQGPLRPGIFSPPPAQAIACQRTTPVAELMVKPPPELSPVNEYVTAGPSTAVDDAVEYVDEWTPGASWRA